MYHGCAVAVKVKLSKGGPRISLYESCKKLQWPMPTFEYVKVEQRYYYFTLGLSLACVNNCIHNLFFLAISAFAPHLVVPHKRLRLENLHSLRQ